MTITDLVYIDATGYHYASYPEFLAWRQQEFRTIYGADVYLGSDSQDGQWVAILAKADFDTAALGASTFNSFSPVTAQGLGLARNVKINGLTKRSATHSTAELVIVGTASTNLVDAIAIDTLQQKWAIPNTTIPFAGTITITATAVDIGAIAALPNTINGIFTPTRGWQTVNNPAAATLGVAVESDAELRSRQARSTANPSNTVFEGTMGAVLNVMDVVKAEGYENDTDATDLNTLPPHSISIVVEGGLDTDVAEAIRIHKTPGTNTYGTTTVATVDSRGMPLDINFYRPTQATINVEVTITPLGGFDSSFEDMIKVAIADYIDSIKIGGDVIITKLYPLAYLTGTENAAAGLTFNVVSIEISKNLDPLSNVNVELDFNEVAVCDPLTDVNVVT